MVPALKHLLAAERYGVEERDQLVEIVIPEKIKVWRPGMARIAWRIGFFRHHLVALLNAHTPQQIIITKGLAFYQECGCAVVKAAYIVSSAVR